MNIAMNFNKNSIFRIFLFLGALSCTAEKKTDPNKVDAKELKIKKLEAQLIKEPVRKIVFSVEKSKSATHSQFLLCTVTKPVRCRPSQDAPGIARKDHYEFLNPLPGDLQIKIRACVEASRADDPMKPCGEWKSLYLGSQSLF